MDWIERMNHALDFIENNLVGEIDYKQVSKAACCSEYHFSRMFSSIAGISLSEYIRRRRLTLAAFELQRSNLKIIDLAIKYGYDSPDSFTRAFQRTHGITPSKARNNSVHLKAFPKISFQISLRGNPSWNIELKN